uniref:AB hydrolase-1 domain-containing protein n=3 Tax=Bionectria ochroleuca TaxID=29856 RepID=A0A0B7K7M9_BIOOC
MDEKHDSGLPMGPSYPGPTPQKHKQASLGQRLGLAFYFLCVSYILCSIFYHSLGLFGIISRPDLVGESAGLAVCDEAPPFVTYEGETIQWQACGEINEHPLECGSIDVPMDQFNASNSGDKTFNIPLIRLRAFNATQGKNLLLNPGGPGGSGIGLVHRRGKQLSTIVGEGYHLVSFDPRGIAASTPKASCYPDSDVRQRLSRVRSKDLVADSPEIFSWTSNFVQACADTMGEHGPYINTPQTAADMNSILDALGQEQMAYWGFSYGTILGQTYASLFPERSERVIIDGVANNFDWFGTSIDQEMWTDTDNVFDGFFDKCIEAGDNCALAGFADTKEEIKNQVLAFGKALQEQPVNVYVNSSYYGLVDYEMLFNNAIFSALYKPANWNEVAKLIASLMKGNATDLFLQYGDGDGFGIEGEGQQFVLLNDAQTGPEHWPQDRQAILNATVLLAESSIFGTTEAPAVYQKQKWNLPPGHHFQPGHGIETVGPLLILSTTYDPVCPLKSARVANEAFKDSRLVEVLGYGHCSISVVSGCLAQHVRNFLYEGVLPPPGAQCEVDAPYFLPPDEQILLVAEDDDSEEGRLYRAQLELAQEMEWPRRW